MGAFSYCSSLPSISIPDSVTSIGMEAFLHCSNLESISLSDSITTIAAGIFSRCYNLTTITIPDNVTSIEGSAFYLCESLATVTIPKSVTFIDDSVFSDYPTIIGYRESSAATFAYKHGHVFLEIERYGDADFNNKIDLKDVQIALKWALKIEPSYRDIIRAVTCGKECVTLEDAQKFFKLALKIQTTYEPE